jgi:hypothetical protein
VVDGWTKVLILICVDQIFDGLGFNNLTKVIMNFMMEGGGLSREELSKKLLCFGVDGVNIFQRGKIRITKQIKYSWAPFQWVCIVMHITLIWQCNPWEI